MKNLPLIILCSAFSMNAMATCLNAPQKNISQEHFSVADTGTVLDTKTGLVWMRCSLGQTWQDGSCQGTLSSYNWQQALEEGEKHVFAAQSDWRLPNVDELKSIVEQQCANPAINSSIFPVTAPFKYWSSSPSSYDKYNAWYVNFSDGSHKYNYKSFSKYVRLVRGGL
ncbi:adhesin [Psychromonas sp. psych-6C06]|uniref:Lcl C-terminal domain-containing protein n=1 Tax=Psychromonas sp. psych-6C06 TaxID=2058089 RepID=UPI000C345793|nr:DUF1566 domain-containing protein [Psychromonas sp. psych-6C06]PKF62630.1 adhesin [Psychromonas sp. psych-6C06]